MKLLTFAHLGHLVQTLLLRGGDGQPTDATSPVYLRTDDVYKHLNDFVKKQLEDSDKLVASHASVASGSLVASVTVSELTEEHVCGKRKHYSNVRKNEGCEYKFCLGVIAESAQAKVYRALRTCGNYSRRVVVKNPNSLDQLEEELKIAKHLSESTLNKMFMTYVDKLNVGDGKFFGVYEFVAYNESEAKSLADYMDDKFNTYTGIRTKEASKLEEERQLASCFVIQQILATLGTISLGYLNTDMNYNNFMVDSSAGLFKYGTLSCPVIKSIDPGLAFAVVPGITSTCAWLTDSKLSMQSYYEEFQSLQKNIKPWVADVKRVVQQALFEEYYSPFATLLVDDENNGEFISPHDDLAIFLKSVIDEFKWLKVDDLDSLQKCSIIRSRAFGNYKALAAALKEKVNQLK
jgi:hypothetical protein